ncbi:GDP-mannose 4,6-dehydratase [Pusillimonas minor]|uniref:GDP-mannose 4,6-dehydratase n=1 Tax=Pusillimonas minor TaxID=2697024 RepID=A0A842HSH0_9BURK|nr:GDP-mannose 4,6-dehydratase [Pusillimonas minor]MBC2770602.1 GDP-mannose 4,6-dehydratase [Pusillimonas minor]
MTKRALIIGVSGQDGAYLSHLLLHKGYEIHGTSRDIERADLSRLDQLGVRDSIRLHSANLIEYRSILEVLRATEPDEIYNLSAQSSVALSFEQPIETLNSIVTATLQLLEAIRLVGGKPRLYNSSSSEMYGSTEGGGRANEDMPFRPRSPYGVSKAAAHWLVESYRKSYGIYACSGILFNHESPLRPERFVTRKIVRSAVDIARGGKRRLRLGNLDVVRDWGWAPDYVDGMWRMLQQDTARDFVLATGEPFSLREFTEAAFAQLDLDWERYVDFDSQLLRPYDVQCTVGDPSRANTELRWCATTKGSQLLRKLVKAEIARCEAAERNEGQSIESLF